MSITQSTGPTGKTIYKGWARCIHREPGKAHLRSEDYEWALAFFNCAADRFLSCAVMWLQVDHDAELVIHADQWFGVTIENNEVLIYLQCDLAEDGVATGLRLLQEFIQRKDANAPGG